MDIAAIWKKDKKYSTNIDSSWMDGIFVMISEDGKRWAGSTPKNLILNVGGIPTIGEPIPMGGGHSITECVMGSWETVRQDLLNNRLGPPDEGTNPLQVEVKQSTGTGTCTCELTVVMNIGCPSNSGNICPNLQI